MEYEHLDKLVQEAMDKHHVPGVAVGIWDQGETCIKGFGVTNVQHPLEVTDETLFQIGSITKTFTATALLRLVEMGKLDLDKPLRTYIPEFKVADEDASAQATARHILTHTGGWVGDCFLDTGAGDDASAKYVARMAELEQLAPLGTVYSYNNAGFYLAGHLIEILTGKTYQAALKELVLEPLELERVYFDPGDVMTYRFAVGHGAPEHADTSESDVVVWRPWPLPRAAYAAGGIACDVPTLLRYAQFHLGDGTTDASTEGERLLSQDTLTLMQTPQVQIREGESAVGLSWHLDTVEGVRLVNHGGGTMGQVSLLLMVPEHNFVLVVFTNADKGGKVISDVERWVLKERFSVERPKPELIDSTEEELRPFVGRYERPLADIELGLLAGRLVGQLVYKQGFPDEAAPLPQAPSPMALARCEGDRLMVTSGSYEKTCVDVIRKPDGSIGWLRMGRLYKAV